MNKIKTFYGCSLDVVQNQVNYFAEKHKILNTSICVEKRIYDGFYYTILVLYEE